MQKLPFIFIFLFFCAGINAQTSLVHKVSFTSIGPSVMSGRVVDIDVNPNQPTEFYVAYASGGLWYTKNNGTSFTAVTENAPTQNMGDIAVDWNSETIWIGTGESNLDIRLITPALTLSNGGGNFLKFGISFSS